MWSLTRKVKEVSIIFRNFFEHPSKKEKSRKTKMFLVAIQRFNFDLLHYISYITYIFSIYLTRDMLWIFLEDRFDRAEATPARNPDFVPYSSRRPRATFEHRSLVINRG